MSYLDALLVQKEPLELHEVTDLKNWLATLEEDCDLLGETPEDTNRMNAIKKKIKENEK